MTAKDDARLHVDREWRTSREITRRIGVWTRIHVRAVLNELAREGLVETRIVPAPRMPFGIAEFRSMTDPAETGKHTQEND